MPEQHSFDYAVLRIVPRVEREEFVNAGVVLFCMTGGFLGALVHLDEVRVRALWPEADLESLRDHLEAYPRICAGTPDSGPIGKLPKRERFQWLVSPRSTMLQVSPTHSGLCEDPEVSLQGLFNKLVL